ncbi:S8 family peptidase [Paenibacillus campi]|uniref:S8 family peptidase n=1 Tax=Paenibacillus campi TaxID=3106031 RepID=UPI002B001A17|nr:S8 family peptidase [Paenibacillus sp. SGZ-1009]
MNDILQLKGNFEQKSSTGPQGAPKLANNKVVTATHLEQLVSDLVEMNNFWSSQTIIKGSLISVYYNKIVAKSNRISGFFSSTNSPSNSTIVGAKFSKERNKHIITHYVSLACVQKTIDFSRKTTKILVEKFNGSIDHIEFNAKGSLKHIDFNAYGISKSKFQQFIVDASYIEKFDIENSEVKPKQTSIVTLYDIGTDTRELLNKLGIKVLSHRVLDNTTILLDENYLELLLEKAPYLVAMAIENISELAPIDFVETFDEEEALIPKPENEPTIGVIDTLFDKRVYFGDWVEFHNMIDKNIPIDAFDYKHGTSVSSIIVDGPSINPNLDDGCGRFKVRHFGVATSKAFNSFTIIRAIKEIVASNKDIRVWNLSLGSNDEINENFISAEASVLDQIQFENDVIFVVAGTNKRITEGNKRIGAPADSINSLIVNSVDLKKQSVAYSRQGIVLSFFTKPDISYYGGSTGEYMSVCEPLGKALVTGTSYAAPWMARKLSYLIDIIGVNKEIAKAMLIDSAIGWEPNEDFLELSLKGHGVVPIRIEDIITSPDDEIKFVVSGVSEKYDTFNYNFPVPVHNNKHPFIAKATLCYFPKCSRNQGVDYTNTELDIYFGRIKNDGKLESINKNKQSIEGEEIYLHEQSARKVFRKWDNVKHICEKLKLSSRGKKVYENKMWGMSIKTKERLNGRDGEGIRFGVVVTLKEIDGVNRIEEFIQQCSLRGWLVNRINVENRIDIYETSNQTLDLE